MRTLIGVVLLYGLLFGVTSLLLPADRPAPVEEAGAAMGVAMGQAITQALAPGVFGVAPAEAASRAVVSPTTYIYPGETKTTTFTCPAWGTYKPDSGTHGISPWWAWGVEVTHAAEIPGGWTVTVYNGSDMFGWLGVSITVNVLLTCVY